MAVDWLILNWEVWKIWYMKLLIEDVLEKGVNVGSYKVAKVF